MALRAFEAAARHLSFTQAAVELFLTQGAISRQIRTLEDFLGQKMFERFTRRVELTEAGSEYYRAVQQALGDIEQATRRAMATRERKIITLSVMPTLGTGWLMPRLTGFSETYPDIDVRLVSSIEPVNFQAGDVDAAIRVGQLPGTAAKPGQPRIELEMVTSWKGLVAEHLFPDMLVPVVSRRLLAQGGPIRTADDLLSYRLIHNASRVHAWPDWLAAHGVVLTSRTQAIHYGHFFMALRAAQNCKGVAIAPSVVLQNFTEGSDLVCPLPADVESAGGYYLLTREADRHDPSIHIFRNWLLAEAANEPPGRGLAHA
ncbi:MAG TPA: LysR substrate-binding domain-containing protein [Burkholderiaceae bacterium]